MSKMSGSSKAIFDQCEKPSKSYIIAPPGCADDDAAVAALPDTWEPRHGGPILANYLRERKQTHGKVLKDITDGAKDVNEKVDAKIRVLAEALLAHIQFKQKEIRCIIKKCDTGDKLEKDARDDAFKNIFRLHSCRIDEISHFKREASKLERERADGLRILLRDQFQRLVSVAHRPPKDLLHDFDERVYEINQQLLSNNRAYTELEAQLRVQADEAIVQARTAINQLCLGVRLSTRGRSAMFWPEERVNERRSASALNEAKRDISAPSLGLIIGDVEGIDECVMRLVQAYKSAVKRVFTGFSDKMCDLEKDLGTHHYFVNPDTQTCEVLDFHEMVEKTLCRLSNSIHKKNIACRELFEMSGADMLAMQKSLWSLGECLQDTFNILHNAGHLWDTHILRQALAQKLAIAAVEDLLTNNDALELANEILFNVALEQLRAAPDVDKLQFQYETIIGMLDRTAEMYRIHSEAELGRLEEFMNLLPTMANTLLAEIHCFLESHPRTDQLTRIDSNKQLTGYTSPRTQYTSIQSPLPRAILQTELQEIALRNWRNGFLESFESNVSLVPEELRRQARLWVEERASALHMRFSLKMVSHSIRCERVKACRDVRLSELNFHESRLDSHLDALYDLIDNLPLDASEFASLDASYLYPFCEWVADIQAGIDSIVLAQEPLDPETKRLKMSSYGPRLTKHRLLFEESLDAAVEIYKRQMEHSIQNARISNVRFMSQIKLHSEGGRYAIQEAIKASTSLIKGADALELCLNRIFDALNHRRTYLLNLADQQVLPLLRICDDIAKTGAKSAPGKGKPPAPAKKK